MMPDEPTDSDFETAIREAIDRFTEKWGYEPETVHFYKNQMGVEVEMSSGRWGYKTTNLPRDDLHEAALDQLEAGVRHLAKKTGNLYEVGEHEIVVYGGWATHAECVNRKCNMGVTVETVIPDEETSQRELILGLLLTEDRRVRALDDE